MARRERAPRMSPARLTGRALYTLYSARFAFRRPLPWSALHEYERRTWSSLAADILGTTEQGREQ